MPPAPELPPLPDAPVPPAPEVPLLPGPPSPELEAPPSRSSRASSDEKQRSPGSLDRHTQLDGQSAAVEHTSLPSGIAASHPANTSKPSSASARARIRTSPTA